jgi:hypothetical protein
MALLIQETIELKNGFILQNPYGRITATDDLSGTFINAYMYLYLDKNSFETGKSYVFPTSVIDYLSIPYSRVIDGVDVLDISHDAFISKLAEQGIVAIKELD